MDLEDFNLINDPDGELIDLIENVNPEREYNIRPRTDHLNYWNDTEFFNRFRLTKATVVLILHEIEDDLRNRTER